MKGASPGRLLFIAREFTRGGAACLALGHIRSLHKHYEIDLLVTGPSQEAMLRLLPAGVEVFHLATQRPRASEDGLGCLELMLEHHEKPPFRRLYLAVLATSTFPDWRACLAVSLVRAGRKLVFLVDESLASISNFKLREQQAMECCLLAADLVVPVSQRLRESLIGPCPPLAQRPWHVLKPPVDPGVIRRLAGEPGPNWGSGDRPIVLTVARLVPDKQILLSLQLHARLRERGIDFRWYVIGEGPEENRLREEIDRLGMGEVFLLVGPQENVFSWMSRCDVFALLSASEGCPTVVLEALLAGAPVLMTDVNGADELIENERTGLIVPNEAEAILCGLEQFLGDETLRSRFRKELASRPSLLDPEADAQWLISEVQAPASPLAVPLVSILIPAFNHEKYIDRAIASALMQDYPLLEVIVLDDASTDRTEELARTWSADTRLRFIRNECNLGRVANYRKALVEHARGEWVLMLDGDDHLLDPGFIRKAWEAVHRHADRAIVFVQAGHRVHYLDKEQQDVDILPPISGPERLMTGGDYLHFVYETGFFTHLGALYRRENAIVNGFYTADISSSDMDSLLRLALEGEVLLLNTVAGCWVQHGGNASSNLPLEQIARNVRIFRQIARLAEARGLVTLSSLEGVLTRYEAQTLAYLFSRTLGKTARSPFAALKMLAIALSINPRLLGNRLIMKTCRRTFNKLAKLSLKRSVEVLGVAFGRVAGRADVP